MGHQCYSVGETGLSGAPDKRVIQGTLRLQAILRTTDRDFFHTLRHQFPEHSGLIVIALKQPNLPVEVQSTTSPMGTYFFH